METSAPRFVFPAQIETERLILRPPQSGNGAIVNAAIRETFADLHQWLDWARELPSVEETETFQRRGHELWRKGEDFPVQAFLKEGGALVVLSGLHVRDAHVPKFEIGYWRRAGYDGKGYVTEVVRALTRLAFDTLGANRIEIRCDERNLRSRRVAERSGFPLEALLRNDEIGADGQLRNTCLYALLPGESGI